MSEITVKDLCPHCGKETIVYVESEKGVLRFSGCRHCNGSLSNLPWENREWLAANILKPK